MSPSTSTCPAGSPSTYEDLGVRRIINCRGTYTSISGSRMLPQVMGAMRSASDAYVSMDELMDRVGARLAELTGADWGLVTSGCAAALVQLSAACMAGGDPERMARLPDATGLNNEVIIQRAHRNPYDRAITMAGARIVEVETRVAYLAALEGHVAMVAIIGDYEEDSTIPIPWMIARAHERSLPCIVDAAAQRPDVPNRYLSMGADAVCYSGGKCLRGPQSAGLVLGRKDLLQAAFLHAAPHHGVARPMKADKEAIMGMLAAVEAWVLLRDHAAEWAAWERDLETIRAAVAPLPTVETQIEQPGLANNAPTMVVSWDAEVLGVSPEQAHDALWDGDPRIALHLVPNGLRIMPYMMELGDDAIAARRLAEVLSSPIVSADDDDALTADVGGEWLLDITFVMGQTRYALALTQNGKMVSGTCRTPLETLALQGLVDGDTVELVLSLGPGGNRTSYRLSGQVSGDAISGEVALGEYGKAAFTSQRLIVAM